MKVDSRSCLKRCNAQIRTNFHFGLVKYPTENGFLVVKCRKSQPKKQNEISCSRLLGYWKVISVLLFRLSAFLTFIGCSVKWAKATDFSISVLISVMTFRLLWQKVSQYLDLFDIGGVMIKQLFDSRRFESLTFIVVFQSQWRIKIVLLKRRFS